MPTRVTLPHFLHLFTFTNLTFATLADLLYFTLLSNIKKLASQTMWYGLSSIAARFINYLLTPFLTYSHVIKTSDFGKMGLIYSALPVLNVLFTYGFETAYFRFSSREEYKQTIYSTTAISLFVSTIIFTVLLWFNQAWIGSATGLSNIPQLIKLSILVIAFDTLSTIPFAKLRQEGRPVKFAIVKILGITINMFLTWFFIGYCAGTLEKHPDSIVKLVYHSEINPIVYVVLANLVQSVFTLLLLFSEVRLIRFRFDTKLWKEMMVYSLPLLIVGFGGIINETFDRLMLNKWLPGTQEFKEAQVGVYNACYKLSILITLFIQAFKMGAEPFFFKQAESANPQRTYARVMKFFILVITVMFLVVSLYLPIWKYFVGPQYRVGLTVVPILLLANIFLGIYYNLSVWFKLSNKTIAGTYITLIGTSITLVVNYFFIPTFGYMASAWATFLCYGTMMVLSFVWGQKAYYIPYAWKKLVAYMVIVIVFFFIQKGLTLLWGNIWFGLSISTLLVFTYCWFIYLVERKEFKKLPVVGKMIK